MSSRPRLLDVCSGAGGCSTGYYRAGFNVTGIDHEPQPRYPFTFVQADAFDYIEKYAAAFDVVHVSPPCQAYSRATAWRGDRSRHPDLIAAMRSTLMVTGCAYVIETVQEGRGLLRDPLMLCGTMLGLNLQRHRYFECSWPLRGPDLRCQHRPENMSFDHGKKQRESVYRSAMGCAWMTIKESRQAIPPVYCEFIGKQLIEHLKVTL